MLIEQVDLESGKLPVVTAVDNDQNIQAMIIVVYNAGPAVRLACHDARQVERGAIAYLRALQRKGDLQVVLNMHDGGGGGLPRNLGSCGGFTSIFLGYSEGIPEPPKKAK